MFTVATLIGLHVIKRERENTYRISKLKMIPAVFSSLATLSSVVFIFFLAFSTEMSYDQQVFFMPLVCGSGFCFYMCILWMTKSRRIIDFMTQVESNSLKIQKQKNLHFIIAGVFFYSLLYAAAAVAMMPSVDTMFVFREGDLKYYSFVPTFFMAFTPSLVDIYMFSFLCVLVFTLQNLSKDVRAVDLWTLQKTTEVARAWLQLRRLLKIYNEVS